MSQSEITPFGTWLLGRIVAAGFRSPSAFANATNIQPSMVLRWIEGRVQPSPEGLLKAAAALNVRVQEMLARGLGIPELDAALDLHPVAVEIDRMLGPDSPLDPAERASLEDILTRLVSSYRKPVQRRRLTDG